MYGQKKEWYLFEQILYLFPTLFLCFFILRFLITFPVSIYHVFATVNEYPI